MEEPKHPLLLILLPLLLSYTLTTSSSLSPIPISPSKSPSAPSPSSSPPSPLRPKPSPSPSPSSSPSSPVRPKPSSSPSTLDPKQLLALQSLNIPTSKDPCSQPSLHNATLCDSGKPFRHLLSLRILNCSDDVELSITALRSLSTLQNLQFFNCPVNPVRFPPELIANLHSFTCINSLRKLTGVWLGRLQNLTDLTVSGVPVNTSGPAIILGNLKKLRSVTISHTNLTGYLPKRWHLNITHIDLSGNRLKGKISTSLTRLADLEILNLSSNAITGEIPSSFGDLLSLQNLSLASNSLSGSIPDSMSDIPELAHLDLSSNQFNGTIPKFISGMKRLNHLNLENNNFQGVMPFNGSFIKRLAVFKVGGNSNLCYNHSIVSSKLKLGIARCDKDGLPVSPPPDKADSAAGSSETGDDDESGDDKDSDNKPKEGHNRGPSRIVLGVAIGLSSIVFLIVFLVLLSKWCG